MKAGHLEASIHQLCAHLVPGGCITLLGASNQMVEEKHLLEKKLVESIVNGRGPNGEIRRWDKKGREGGKKRGLHWHDSSKP